MYKWLSLKPWTGGWLPGGGGDLKRKDASPVRYRLNCFLCFGVPIQPMCYQIMAGIGRPPSFPSAVPRSHVKLLGNNPNVGITRVTQYLSWQETEEIGFARVTSSWGGGRGGYVRSR